MINIYKYINEGKNVQKDVNRFVFTNRCPMAQS